MVAPGNAPPDAEPGVPLTQIQYGYEYRFIKPPPPPKFGAFGSVLSILSLVLMTALSMVMLLQLLDPQRAILAGLPLSGGLPPPAATGPLATWTWVPFAFTIFGAGVGALFELYLLITGTPFEQMRSKGTAFVLRIRLLNLAPVTGSIFFFVACMVVTQPSLRVALLLFSGLLTFGLGFALFYGGAEKVVPLVLIGTQFAGAVMVVAAGVPVGGRGVEAFLVAQPVLQTTALLIGTSTPLKSTAFHVTATLSGVMLYRALLLATAVDPKFSHEVAVLMPFASLLWWSFVFACVTGLVLTARLSPRTYNAWRSGLSNAFWSPLYFLLVSAPRFPKPFNLSQVYKNGNPRPTRLRPYYIDHPEFLPESLSIPSAVRLEGNVNIFVALVKKARKSFALIALGDHLLPQANSAAPLAEKPRLEVWSNGSNYWPGIFGKKFGSLSLPNPEPEVVPPAAVEAFKAGQELAYLCESGVGATMLNPSEREGELVLDLRFLEKYQTKPDYEPYGGQALFRINPKEQRLELVHVIPPRGSVPIVADPDDATFRHAEAMLLASLYYWVVSGKHLGEIHMTYNLVEVAMHNAFDAQGQYMHPFRTFMYLHLFSHELAEELTTEHLVQEGAVFTQIFATTHDALIDHLNDVYHSFEYGTDENFEARAKMFTVKGDDGTEAVLPKSAIAWELEYAEIWSRYTTALVEIIYDDNAAVVGDRYIQDFYRELLVVLPNGLPERYDEFKTRKGLARFASDTIHHLVIRHQVYGTTGVPGLDPRISKTQVPRDGGTSGVDEWRSLASVALATAHARFTLLLDDFKYLLDGVSAKYKEPMGEVFDRLQEDLHVLDAEWNATDSDRRFNANYFRAIPSDLHTGPGY